MPCLSSQHGDGAVTIRLQVQGRREQDPMSSTERAAAQPLPGSAGAGAGQVASILSGLCVSVPYRAHSMCASVFSRVLVRKSGPDTSRLGCGW